MITARPSTQELLRLVDGKLLPTALHPTGYHGHRGHVRTRRGALVRKDGAPSIASQVGGTNRIPSRRDDGPVPNDCFTMPLQEALFREMRDLIMNIDPTAADLWDHRMMLEDDVGSR
jgi:hypothetical protein